MSIEGVYELADVEKGRVSLRIKADGDGKWRVQAKVANNMNCVVTEENGVFTPGRVMSTKMMPVPEMEELENHISKLISGLTNITKEGKANVSVLNEPIILFIFQEMFWSLRGLAVLSSLNLLHEYRGTYVS